MGQKESSPFAHVLDQLDKDKQDGREGGLSNLNLSGVRIDETTAKIFADYMRRRDLTRLKYINLGDCGLTYSAFHHLVEAMCSRTAGLTRLDMNTSDMPPVGNPLGMKSANSIGMILRRCSLLTHLRLGNCNLDCSNVIVISEAITNNRTLKTLDLSYNHISDIGAVRLGYALQHNRTLEGLQLWKNHITSEGAEGLSAGLVINPHLQWLGLGCNNIGDDGVCSIAEALTTNIEGSSLVWLGLGNNHISDRGAMALANLLGSGITSIDEDEGDEGTACTLTTLGLGGNDITNDGAIHLAQALDRNEVLKSIGLSHNRISNEGAQAIADMLRNNNTLEKLSLSANDISNEGGEPLIASLTQNTSLTTLLLAQNPLGDQVCDRCAEVFTRYNFSVQILDLKNTRISNKAFRKYVMSLKNSDAKLRALGGSLQSDTVIKNGSIPVSGNLLEIANWRPPASSALMRRKLFEGVQVTQRAHALLSLPSSALTPKAIGRRNSMVQDRQALLSKWNNNNNNTIPVIMDTVDIPEMEDNDIEEQDETRPSQDVVSMAINNTHHLGLPGYQYPNYSPDLHNLRKQPEQTKRQSNNAMELRPLEGERIQYDVPDEADSRYSDVMEERETWFSNMPQRKETERQLGGEEERETEFNDEEEEPINGERVRVTFSHVEMKWVEEDIPEEEQQQHENRVRFNKDIEILETPFDKTTSSIIADSNSTNSNNDHNGNSWISSDTTEADWTTVDMMEIPQNVSLLEINKKSRRGSVIRSRYKEEDSGSEDEVIVIDSEGEPSDEEHPIAVGNTHQVQEQEHGNGKSLIMREHENRESVSLDDIHRRSLLPSPTKDRIKPTGRRLPSISPSSSIGSIGRSDQQDRNGTEIMEEVREEEEEEVEEEVLLTVTNDIPQIISEKPTKDQWIDSLKQSINILQSGQSLLSSYQSIISMDYNYVTTSAKFPCNIPKNRSGAPLPPNRTRVKLQLAGDELGTDYINASFLGSPVYDKSYIITQWPSKHTISDFWRMIWEQRVGVVVVLGSIKGEGIFWPKFKEDQTHPLVVGDKWSDNSLYINTWKKQRVINDIEELYIQVHSYDDNITETMKLIHYPHWPMNGVPDSIESVKSVFHWSVAARQNMIIGSPLLVVSPNGSSIAGSFVAVSVAYELIQTPDPTPFDNNNNIIDSVYKGLLELRPGLLTVQEQYEYTYILLDNILSSVNNSNSQEHHSIEDTDNVTVTKTRKSGKGFFRRKKSNDSKTKQEKKSKKSVKTTITEQAETTDDRNALIL